jgi:hypothetical protein
MQIPPGDDAEVATQVAQRDQACDPAQLRPAVTGGLTRRWPPLVGPRAMALRVRAVRRVTSALGEARAPRRCLAPPPRLQPVPASMAGPACRSAPGDVGGLGTARNRERRWW